MDLHVHTKFSFDSLISPKRLVDSLYSHPLIKGVAITDHDSLEGYFRTRELAKAYDDILIVPGIEINTTMGHLIILGVEENPFHCDSPNTVIDFARDRDGVVVIPHPYRFGGIGKAAEKTWADAVEILNPQATSGENKLAERLAKLRALPGVAGSDAHKHHELWTAYTIVDAEQEIESVLSAIKRGRVKAKLANHA